MSPASATTALLRPGRGSLGTAERTLLPQRPGLLPPVKARPVKSRQFGTQVPLGMEEEMQMEIERVRASKSTRVFSVPVVLSSDDSDA